MGAPNRLLVADFTYVRLATGAFCYVAFVIDAYAGAIIGWDASMSKQTRFVESAIRQAAALRSRQGHPIDGAIHHSDAGLQFTAVRFGGTLIEASDGVPAVVGTTALLGDWDPAVDRVGHRRRVHFANGHYLAEEVLEDAASTFSYMIWDFTESPQRFAVDHALARFDFEEVGDSVRLSWTYSFMPRYGITRPLVARFVEGPMATMMSQSMTAWRDAAEAELWVGQDAQDVVPELVQDVLRQSFNARALR